LITFEFEDLTSEVAQAALSENAYLETVTRKRVAPFCQDVHYSFIAETSAEILGQKVVIRISSNIVLPIVNKIKVITISN